ncbi:hypothetical protein DPSP01_001459 [Paraphaeosphaeria sporulosa]
MIGLDRVRPHQAQEPHNDNRASHLQRKLIPFFEARFASNKNKVYDTNRSNQGNTMIEFASVTYSLPPGNPYGGGGFGNGSSRSGDRRDRNRASLFCPMHQASGHDLNNCTKFPGLVDQAVVTRLLQLATGSSLSGTKEDKPPQHPSISHHVVTPSWSVCVAIAMTRGKLP